MANHPPLLGRSCSGGDGCFLHLLRQRQLTQLQPASRPIGRREQVEYLVQLQQGEAVAGGPPPRIRAVDPPGVRGSEGERRKLEQGGEAPP